MKRAHRPERGAPPERGAQTGRSARPERNARTERNARPEQSTRPEQRGRPEQSTRPQRKARTERAAGSERAERTERGDGSERVVGLNAAHAALRVRPEHVLNIAYTPQARRAVKELLREAAQRRIAYREVDEAELERIADTVHHEGVCLLTKPRPQVRVDDLLRRIERGGLLVALDHVENPHNVGALVRSLAFFGVRGLLLVSTRERGLTPAAVRVAEGGAEYVPICVVPDLVEPLAALSAAGVQVIGADAHRGESAAAYHFPARAILVLGSERHGLDREIEERCTTLVHIPGTNAVESLNVSVAAGVLLAFATRGGARAS